MTTHAADVTQALREILKDGKGPMKLSDVAKAMDAGTRSYLGIAGKPKVAEIEKALAPCLGDGLTIFKKGNSSFLTVRLDVGRYLEAIMTGKDFLPLSEVAKAMSKELCDHLGLSSSSGKKPTDTAIKKSLEPHMGAGMEIRKGGGKPLFLVRKDDPLEIVARHIAAGPGMSVKRAVDASPFAKVDTVAMINDLLRAGRVTPLLTEKIEVCLFPAGLRGHAAAPAFVDRRAELRAAFDELDRGRIFVRICELRRKLGWPHEGFDEQLRRLRDEEIIQLHQGDITSMTPEDVRDCFIDENGYRMGTVTWHGKR